MVPLPRNPKQPPPPPPSLRFPLFSPPSLTSISPPLNFPLLVTTATGEGQKKKRREMRREREQEREGEVCRVEAKSTKEEKQQVSAEEPSGFVAPVGAWLRCLEDARRLFTLCKRPKRSLLKQ